MQDITPDQLSNVVGGYIPGSSSTEPGYRGDVRELAGTAGGQPAGWGNARMPSSTGGIGSTDVYPGRQ